MSRSRGLESSAHTPGECMTTSPSSQSYHRVCAIGLRYTSIDPPWYGCVSSFYFLHSHLTPRSPSRFPNSLRNTLSLPSPLLSPSFYLTLTLSLSLPLPSHFLLSLLYYFKVGTTYPWPSPFVFCLNLSPPHLQPSPLPPFPSEESSLPSVDCEPRFIMTYKWQ